MQTEDSIDSIEVAEAGESEGRNGVGWVLAADSTCWCLHIYILYND